MNKFKVKIWNKIPKEACGDLLELYNELKYDYYNCIFFDNCEEMYKWYDKKFGKIEPTEHNYDGLCKYDSKMYFLDEECQNFYGYAQNCGYILLSLEDFCVDTMTHEISHAITFYFQYRIKERNHIFDSCSETNYNELFCYMSGRMARQINNKYYKILKEKE